MTSDAGLLLPRELDERLGLGALIARYLTDPRTGRNFQFALPDLCRQSIYSRLAGYEDTNDAERVSEDPTFRMLASRERRETSVALTSTRHWFETEALNRHFESVCYHPLFAFNHEGDGLAVTPRAGNVHSADGWEKVLLPVIDRVRARGQTVVVRADAAFAIPALYEALEQRGVTYAIRLPANQVLERGIEDLLTRPRGRSGYARWCAIAASRTMPRRGIGLAG